MPKDSSGTIAPPVRPLFDASLAMMPSREPLPSFCGCLEKFFACDYDIREAALPPTPGRIHRIDPMNGERIVLTVWPLISLRLNFASGSDFAFLRETFFDVSV